MPAHLTTLVSRMEKYKLKDWRELGRLKRSMELSDLGKSKFLQWKLTAGRLIVDSKYVFDLYFNMFVCRSAAMELVRSRSHDLEDLVEKILFPIDLNAKRISLSAELIVQLFK